MFRYKWIGFLLSVSALFQNIGFDPKHEGFVKANRQFNVKKIARIDFEESSGLEYEKPDEFWTHNDSGGDPALYRFTLEGHSVESLPLNLKNRDWEDITRDDKGIWYIGEFGNNGNRRRNLKIYIIEKDNIDSIQFSYPDQTMFPPAEEDRNFDCEAFFWHNDFLYLFSKNRGNHMVKSYRLEARSGEQTAELLDTIRIKRMVTGADIDSRGQQYTLLTYGMVYTFGFDNPDKPFSQPISAMKFTRSGQAEGISYLDQKDMIVSNEAGKIFLISEKD